MKHLIIGVSAAAIAVIWGGSAFMNYQAVYTYGLSPMDAQFYSTLSVAGDVIKALAASVVGYALYRRKWLVSLLALTFLLGTVLWSANSAIRYASANIIGKFQQGQVNEVLTKTRLAKLEMEKDRFNWLKNQTVSKYHKERKRMTAEINDARKSFDKALADLENGKVTLDADPHYSLLSQIFGISEGDAARGTALLFACLIEFIAGFGWFVIASVYAPEPRPKNRNDVPKKQPENINAVSENPIALPLTNVVQMVPKETAQKSRKQLLDQWFAQDVVMVKHPCIQASYAYKSFVRSTGEKIPRNMFFKYMRERLPEHKIKRIPKGLHYYIAIKDDRAAHVAASLAA